eukprot:COSAG01_NODE_10992_length_2031_cov_1.522257_4_plen_155_part_00
MFLLRAADGRFRTSAVSPSQAQGGGCCTALVDRCGDAAIWETVTGTTSEPPTQQQIFRSVVTGEVIDARQAQLDPVLGPQKLPSEYLHQLQERGYVLIEGLLTPSEAANVRRAVFGEMAAQSKSEGVRGAGAWEFVKSCPAGARAARSSAAHPQ